jgi:nucleoside-diphosphate-sugar epimerase
MRVMVTGAFGNVGESALVELMAQGHRVRAFDLRSRAARRVARRVARRRDDRLEVSWGDIRDPLELARAVAGVDAVAHIAFVIPPQSERRPEWAREINVGGTHNLIAAMRALPRPPRLVYTSSVSVVGPRGPEDEPPVTAAHPTKASDTYTAHKIETEAMVRASGLDWTILRLGGVLPLELPKRFHPMTFDIPEDQRIEVVHTRDVGLAVANAVRCDEALGRTLMIAGGKGCRLRSRQLRTGIGELLGMPAFPESAFSPHPYYTDFMDTAEAQHLLRFQRHSFDEYLDDVRAMVPRLYPIVLRPFGGLIRRQLLKQSPHHRASPE